MPISDSNKSYFDDQSAVADILNNNGPQGALTVGTTAIEVKVGVARLEGRKSITLYNNSNATIYWGYTSGVTTSTGTPIKKEQQVTWAVGDTQTIFVIAGSTNNNTRITEGA